MLLLRLLLIALLSDSALLGLHVKLDVDFHWVLLLVLLLVLQLFGVGVELLDLGLLREDLLGELKLALAALRITLRVPISHFEDREHAIYTCREEECVCVGDAEAGDSRCVGLNYLSLLKGQLPDLDGSGVGNVALLAHTSEDDAARVMHHQLAEMVLEFGQRGHCVSATTRDSLKLLRLGEDDLLAAHCKELIGSSWDVKVDN